MKYIIILLALGFQIACSNDNKPDDSKKNQETAQAIPEILKKNQEVVAQDSGKTQTNSPTQDFQTEKTNDPINLYLLSFDELQKVAKQGHAEAQRRLGSLYFIGKGVEQSYTQAFIWYKKAAEQGEAEAQFSLGWMYEFGKGVEQDYKQAFGWYKKAADQGHANAQNNLSVLYERGLGVEQSDNLASFWKQKSEE